MNIHIKEQLKKLPLSWLSELNKQQPDAEVYLVGGAVRDLLLDREIKDIDLVIRNLEVKKLEDFLEQHGKTDFVGKSFGVYKFQPNDSKNKTEIDIALPRTEKSFNTGVYKDFKIESDYNLKIEKDLGRRDFTINAMALKLSITDNELQTDIIDPFDGQKDLIKQIIKTVGEAKTRFQEDASRMLRAVRFACQLNFDFDKSLIETIQSKNSLVKQIAPERTRKELDKIIMSEHAEKGFRIMQKLGLLKIIIPELDNCVGVDQSRNHIYEVFEHQVRALGFAAKKNYDLEARWATLLHDIGKPITKAKSENIYTFLNHEIVGANMTKKILKRLRYSDKTIKTISHFVRHHMFYYNTDEITDSAVRRLVKKIEPENIDNLIKIRIADRLGMGRPKGKPFKLIELERRIKEVSLDPISVKMLKLDGQDVIKILKINPGVKIGLLLNALLNEVLEDPTKNEKEILTKKLVELNKLTEKELKQFSPDLEKHEEQRRNELIGDPLVFKGKTLSRLTKKIVSQKNRRHRDYYLTKSVKK